jgi:hypothetical protein
MIPRRIQQDWFPNVPKDLVAGLVIAPHASPVTMTIRRFCKESSGGTVMRKTWCREFLAQRRGAELIGKHLKGGRRGGGLKMASVVRTTVERFFIIIL